MRVRRLCCQCCRVQFLGAGCFTSGKEKKVGAGRGRGGFCVSGGLSFPWDGVSICPDPGASGVKIYWGIFVCAFVCVCLILRT